MSSARGHANRGLYLAKIVLAAWQRSLAEQEIPAGTLNQAFLPAVQEHLHGAYGWFLLALSGVNTDGGRPPRACSELPEVAAGKVVSGELREFRQLEADGWLARMLETPEQPSESSSSGNLATAVGASADLSEAQQWALRLEALFERMSDSLDEY